MNKWCFLIVGILMSACWKCGTTSMTGYVVKMDGEGVIWQTMEAKVMEGSLQSGHTSEEINVPPVLVSVFEEAMNSQSKVKVTWQRELVVAPWRGSSNAIATKIEIIK